MMVRWPILRTLLGKEWLRLRKQPMALMLLGLLTAISILIATSGPQLQRTGTASRLPTCWIVYDSSDEWIEHLRQNIPESPPIRIVPIEKMPQQEGAIVYPSGDCGIELISQQRRRPRVIFRYPGPQPNVMWPHAQWFWGTTAAYLGDSQGLDQVVLPVGRGSPQSAADMLKQTSLSDLMTLEMIGSLLLFGVQFFCCAHLLISFTAQERERGTLLAMALTPASIPEILLAKCLFHGGLSLAMSGVIIGILKPTALAQPLLWGTLIVSAMGFLSVGILVATFARTQATAALLTLCYMLGVALVFHLSKGWASFSMIRELMFEHRGFLLVHSSLRTGGGPLDLIRLGWLATVVLGWVTAATALFQHRGWRG